MIESEHILKKVLITGGTGTFGKNLINFLLKKPIESITVFSRDEFKQHQMKMVYNTDKIKYIIGDIRDFDALNNAFRDIDIVYHAAAIKHVKIAEDNPMEAIKTNILGTNNVIEAAIKNNVNKVIAVSTDKAVMPTNLYGSTKLCLEKLIINANKYSPTKFSVVRYGNVLCSRGSVVPIFLKLKDNNLAIKVTDMGATRFTITIGDAIKFVTECAENAIGGEIFVPKLPSYSLQQLVQVICPNREIIIIGLQKGEKMHEQMICNSESSIIIENDNRYIICPEGNITKYYELYGDSVCDSFNYTSDNNVLIDNNVLKELISANLDQC